MRELKQRLRRERGQAVIEGLLALGLVLLVVAVCGQAFAYAHARTVAIAAAQEGANAAAIGGAPAGTIRAEALLRAAGGAGAQLDPVASVAGTEVTVTVTGRVPTLFPLGLLVPTIDVSASLPLEHYPAAEQAR